MPTSTQSRLLATKTQRPRLPGRLVRRERLFALMDASRVRTLTVIKAAAGFGKTSLALAWADHLARQNQRIAWVSLDPEDDEPGQFLLYMAQALRSAWPEIDGHVLGLIDEVSLIRPLDVVHLLINALTAIDEEMFLFLDDFHVLQHADVAECAGYLLRHAPPQLHVVITTRTEPDLPLVRLRGQGELLEIDADALRFDLDETKHFLEQEVTGRIAASEAAGLHAKTEGWPVMMRIVATTSQQSGRDLTGYMRQLSAHHRPIRSHLVDMLNGLPGDVIAFLLKTSVLESLCIPLCQAVVETAQAEAIFESLVSRQFLLTPLDADGLWFRYHPLLRSFLQQRLELEFPETVADLHRRAYAWYAKEQRWTDAIRHAIAVGDTAEAVQWIGNCAMGLLKRGELGAILAWERIVPPELMRRQVKARLAIAWGMALAMRFDEAQQLATQIETEIGRTQPDAREAIGCECQTIRAVALALSDDIESALDLAEESLRRRSSGRWTTNVAANVALIGLWKRGDLERCYDLPWLSSSGDDSRNVVATVYRLCLLGIIEYEQLHQAMAYGNFQRALRVASEHAGPNSASAAQPATLIAQYLYDQGKVDEAEAMLANRLPTINAVCMLECVLRAYTVLVRIAAYRGFRENAEELLDQAHQLSASRRWLRLEAMALRERVRIAVLNGDVGLAESLVGRLRGTARRAADMSPALQSAVRDDLDFSEVWLNIIHGDSDKASDRLRGIAERATAKRNKRLELESMAVLGAALAGDAPNPAGLAALRSALRLLPSCGPLQLVADCLGFARRNLAVDLQQIDVGRDPEIATELASLLPEQGALQSIQTAGHVATQDATTSLSRREQDILTLLAKGRSNKDIARELRVAPETVKTHVKRIFLKMNVSNRSQAISKFFQSF